MGASSVPSVTGRIVLQAAQGQMPEPVSEDGLGTVQILGPYQSREPGRGELVLAVYAHGGAFDSR